MAVRHTHKFRDVGRKGRNAAGYKAQRCAACGAERVNYSGRWVITTPGSPYVDPTQSATTREP